MASVSLLQTPPLSVYVHLPWCVRKCPYCDFNSYAIDSVLPEKRYIAALDRDLESQADWVRDRQVQSIFFGGGTPSLFSPAAIGEIVSSIRARLTLEPTAEITLEANPGTIERGRFAEYRAAGVNRVSLGGQSFNERHLKLLGRIHTSRETDAAAQELHAAGLENFNIDLMYGLPQQAVADALEDIRAALALRPQHISHYQLTLEPGTVFFHRPPTLPSDDDTWRMQIECQQALAASGFMQYEISAYARENRRCMHNLNYWQFGDYVGIGAGAHGKLTDTDSGAITRTARLRQPRQYLESIETGVAELTRVTIPSTDLPFEFMLNALRLPRGFSSQQFVSRTGEALDSIKPILEEASKRGLMEASADGSPGYRPTELGLRFLNDLQGMFLPERSASTRAASLPQVVNLL